MDQYLQREKGIELWKGFAASTPKAQRRKLPPNKNTANGVQNVVFEEWSEWAKNRKWNGEHPCDFGFGGTPATDIIMVPDKPERGGCAIMYGDDVLEGATLAKYEKDINCKVLSDSSLAHENVHKEHCMAAYAQSFDYADQLLSTPEYSAESELQAWTKQKEVLGEAIRNIIRKNGCGWKPTKGQKNRLGAVPSIEQMQKMEQQGWKAAKALSKGRKK
jgi:hypothetical protein